LIFSQRNSGAKSAAARPDGGVAFGMAGEAFEVVGVLEGFVVTP